MLSREQISRQKLQSESGHSDCGDGSYVSGMNTPIEENQAGKKRSLIEYGSDNNLKPTDRRPVPELSAPIITAPLLSTGDTDAEASASAIPSEMPHLKRQTKREEENVQNLALTPEYSEVRMENHFTASSALGKNGVNYPVTGTLSISKRSAFSLIKMCEAPSGIESSI